MRTHFAAPAAGILLLATGCTQNVDSKAVNIEAERAALMSVDRALTAALESPDRSKLASFYAPDATVYAPGMQVIKGHEAISRLLQDPLSGEGTQFDFTTSQMQVATAAGDIAYTTGAYRVTRPGGRSDTGKYVTIWKKQGDGNWLIVEDIFNGDEPVASTPVAAAH